MRFLFALVVLFLPMTIQAAPPEGGESVEMTVYRSPSCSCCGRWIEHVKAQGFKVKDVLEEEMEAVKKRYGVPQELQSCHTALVGGYVIEGHVPAEDVQRLLTEKPPIAGLSVPGMPRGTPGMEMGGRKDPYAVVQFDRQGKSSVFHDYSQE